MSYQEEAGKVAEAVTTQVVAALAAYEAGRLTYNAATGLIAAYVAAGNSAAAVIGDLAVAAAVTVQTGTPAPPLGITRPAGDADRLTKAAQTILDDLDSDADLEAAYRRLDRLADAETRKAAADAHSQAVARSKSVTGWTRGLEPEACQLCRWWWREGQVWSADHPFQTHTGCDCSQLITTREEATA